MNATLEVTPQLAAEVVAIRRDLHAHPELGFEQRTAAMGGIDEDALPAGVAMMAQLAFDAPRNAP